MSHWLYRGKVFDVAPEDAFGFVYRITNLVSGKKYIGRKYFESVRRKKVKNKVRRKVVIKNSGWASYTGSNKSLTEDIAAMGIDKFRFEILAIGYTKGHVNYLEENIQHKLDVITSEKYYNHSVGSRKFIGITATPELQDTLAGLKEHF